MGFVSTKSAVSTHFSNFRKVNEDNFSMNGRCMSEKERNKPVGIDMGAEDKMQYFAVSDGMGGEGIGDLASLTVVEGLRQEYRRFANQSNLQVAQIKEGLKKFVHSTNRTIYYLVDEPAKERVGATIGFLLFWGNEALVMNVGNSRVYLLRKGILSQLSVDHTVTEKYASMGIDRAQTMRNGGDKQLTKTLGIDPAENEVDPDFSEVFDLQEGDRFLLCTDGLSIPLSETEIKDILMEYENPSTCSERLVSAALMEKTKDNVTAMVVDVEKVSELAKEAMGVTEEERLLLHSGSATAAMDNEEGVNETLSDVHEKETDIESWYKDVEEEIKANQERVRPTKKFNLPPVHRKKEIVLGLIALLVFLLGFGIGRWTAPKGKGVESAKATSDEKSQGDSLSDIIYAPEEGENKENQSTEGDGQNSGGESEGPGAETQTGEGATGENTTGTSNGNTDNKPKENTSSGTGEVTDTYIVQKGDTLYSISVKFYGNGGKVNDIMKLNGIKDAGKIYPKQELKLPPK